MLAQNNKYIEEASATVYQLSQEERIRLKCEAREDYYRTQLGMQQMLDEKDAALEAQTAQLTAQAAQIEALNAEINKLHKWMEMHGHNPAEI